MSVIPTLNPAVAALYAQADELALKNLGAWAAIEAIEQEQAAVQREIERLQNEDEGND